MNDDYLWDRSGQPDPEIKQLEEILGELRYQPRPLEIPGGLKTGHNHFHVSRFAIAASVAMIVLGVGAWMAIQKQSNHVTLSPEHSKPAEVKTVTPPASNENSSHTAVVNPIEENKPTAPRHVRVRSRARTIRTPQLSSEELAEAVAAKERLMMAMRLASSKLNYAQKKAQGSNPAQPVYHQHKIG